MGDSALSMRNFTDGRGEALALEPPQRRNAALRGYRPLAFAVCHELRLQRDDPAVFLDVDRCAVHAGGLARDLGGAPKCAPDGFDSCLRILAQLFLFARLHVFFSTNLGLAPELSYTI